MHTKQKSMIEDFKILTLIFKHTTCFSIYLIQDAAFFYGKMKLILQWWAACLYYVNCICINAIGWLVLHYRVGILIKTNRFCHILFTCFSILIPSRLYVLMISSDVIYSMENMSNISKELKHKLNWKML